MRVASSTPGITRASARCSSAGLRCDNEMRDAEIDALRSLIDQRRVGVFVDLDKGEAETRVMLERKRKTRATL